MHIVHMPDVVTGKDFMYSHEEILEKYGENMKMVERIPDVLAGAMGNQMYVARFVTKEGMDQFYNDVLISAKKASAEKSVK